MTLPNLARLTEQATPGPWEFVKQRVGLMNGPWLRQRDGVIVADPCWANPQDEPLIAAAPQMAELLIACEEALREAPCLYDLQPGHCRKTQGDKCPRCALLARLADFDRRIA